MGNDICVWGRAEWADFLREAQEFVPIAVVEARRLTDALEWRGESGDHLCAQDGDWLVTDGESSWTVAHQVFVSTYAPTTSKGTFHKVGPVRARRLTRRTAVQTLEGVAHGDPGDWLVQNITGDTWPVPAALFARRYAPRPSNDVSDPDRTIP